MNKPIVIGTKVQGASHKRSNTECQDNYKYLPLDDDSLVLAVADGHGSKSCPYSRTGSLIAVNVFCQEIGTLFNGYKDNLEVLLTLLNREGDTSIAHHIYDEWKKRVFRAHKKNKREIDLLPLDEGCESINYEEVYKQYGTTLIGMLVTPVFVFALQIGDGDITYVDELDARPFLTSSKILGVETHSLSKKNAWEKAITKLYRTEVFLKADSVIMLSTDGFSNSYKNEEEFKVACKEYREMILQYGSEAVLANLKDWLNETSEQGCGDDITLIMLFFGKEKESEESDDSREECSCCDG